MKYADIVAGVESLLTPKDYADFTGKDFSCLANRVAGRDLYLLRGFRGSARHSAHHPLALPLIIDLALTVARNERTYGALVDDGILETGIAAAFLMSSERAAQELSRTIDVRAEGEGRRKSLVSTYTFSLWSMFISAIDRGMPFERLCELFRQATLASKESEIESLFNKYDPITDTTIE